jgi:threonylcarbamoyladenosine tRNA methylthiotransferase MtaB
MPGPGTHGRTIYLLRVQTGCNEACAYCVVPVTRGPSRSAPIDDVLREVSEAAAAGFKEVMLTGVHLGCYGRELAPSRCLADLVAALADSPADVRFRLSAVEPMDVDGRLADILARAGRFAPHFHLPLQHASNRVLRAMGRPYTIEQYARTLDMLADRFPDAALGADLIAGFPGETESDFDACRRYLAGSPLTHLHVFPFSPRPATAAATLGDRPPGPQVRERVRHLRAIGAAATRRFRSRFVGTVRDGLTIGDGSLVLTDNYLRVGIPPGLPRNERVRVRIVAGDGGGLRGTASTGLEPRDSGFRTADRSSPCS